MPPRRSARVAAVAERESSALPPLPLSLALAVFALLPVDARLRCREVCRGWRAVLTERSLWLRLDLSEASGGLARPATEGLLRAAASRAGGQLHSLDVSKFPGIAQEALLAVLTANAGALRELRAWTVEDDRAALPGFPAAEALLRAAPQLRVFDADVECNSVADAQRLLRNEGAWAPLWLRKLRVIFDAQTEAAVLSLAGDLAAHSSLVELSLISAPLDTPAALDAIVAAALANRFSSLTLGACSLSPASAPALARLLGGGAVRSLLILNGNALLDAAAAALLGDALRMSCALKLMLAHAALWHDPAVAVTLLGAVTGHRSLQRVSLYKNPIGDAQEAAGAALGALVAANSPALVVVDLRECDLQEAALGPLVDALPANTHLCMLHLGEVTASATFLRERLLPAVRANTSLTLLDITVTGKGEGAAREAQEIVKSRAAR
jgi:hypothetical protein